MSVPLRFARWVCEKIDAPGLFVFSDVVARLFPPQGLACDGNIAGYSFRFDFRDELQRQMYFGLYDRPELRLLKRILRPGDVLLDIGANIGYYSLVASQAVGLSGQVHAFEPIAQNIEVLQKAIAENAIENIIPNPVAVGASSGTIELYVSHDELGNTGWASIVPSERRPVAVSVNMICIDSYMREMSIDRVRLVKLDIEGAELEALQGMADLLAGEVAPDLLCEINPYLLAKRNMDSTVLTRWLANKSYRLYRVTRRSLDSFDPDERISSLVNVYCTKQAQAQR